MKIHPLPETDLARIAPLPADQKRNALEHFRLARPPYSYAPVRKSVSDILNIAAGFLGTLPRTPYSKIAEAIAKDARSDEEADANLSVAAGLYEHAELQKLTGRRHDIFPMAIGTEQKVVYWHSLILNVNGRPVVPFIDPRRTATQLSSQGRRFAFSMMHERIRVADPDFSEVALGIFQFLTPKTGPRRPHMYIDDGIRLFSFEELDRMVRETYAIWQEICEERAERARRSVSSPGGLFG